MYHKKNARVAQNLIHKKMNETNLKNNEIEGLTPDCLRVESKEEIEAKSSKKSFTWGVAAFLFGYQLLTVISMAIYLSEKTPSTGLLVTSFVLWYLTGLSITIGYHRFYSHRTHQPGKIFEFILLTLGTLATQGSAIQWSFNHRRHHRYTDTERDPHSIKEGFWHAHMGWMLRETEPVDLSKVQDLAKNKWAMFQHEHYGKLVFGANAITTIIVAYLFNDFWGAMTFALGLRMMALHHFTWFINSLAHTWGSRSYARELTAVDNYLIALFTFGEGYHNYHHAFPSDYRNGIRWYHYDPSKWIIWSFDKLGLTSDKQIMNAYVTKGKIIKEDKKLFHDILEKYEASLSAHNKHAKERLDHLKTKMAELSDQISENLSEIQKTVQAKARASACTRKEYKRKIKLLKAELKNDWNSWLALSKQVLKLA